MAAASAPAPSRLPVPAPGAPAFPEVQVNTTMGSFTVELYATHAPKTCNNFLELARRGYYDNVVFHRIIPDSFVQGGDPTGTGMSGSDKPDLKAEFNSEPHTRGTCSMARTQVPDSANSQFFIMFAPGHFLNGQYTVVGEVTEGMDVVDAIKRGAGRNGEVMGQPDRMVSVTVTE